jgi:hypothetical protein
VVLLGTAAYLLSGFLFLSSCRRVFTDCVDFVLGVYYNCLHDKDYLSENLGLVRVSRPVSYQLPVMAKVLSSTI